jgi:hypothetical protein
MITILLILLYWIIAAAILGIFIYYTDPAFSKIINDMLSDEMDTDETANAIIAHFGGFWSDAMYIIFLPWFLISLLIITLAGANK